MEDSDEGDSDLKTPYADIYICTYIRIDIYKYIGEVRYTDEITKDYIKDILKDKDMDMRDVIIQDMTISYMSNKKNPLKNIRFYNKHNINKSYYLTKDSITKIMPKEYNERTLRVFSKNNENNT